MTKNKTQRETKPMSIPVALLTNAEWNTHRASKKDDAAYIGLIDNIKANGMLHRVVVAPLGGEDYVIVDGHRRVEAARALGWKEVPCEVYPEMPIEEAKAMTLSANVQRLENDPLLEAACIQELADAGKTYEQIAAVLGKDARYVARRARLCNLTKQWADWFAKIDGVDVDLMEFVASHETELQSEVFVDFICEDDGTVDTDAEINKGDIRRQFKRRLRKLEDAIFDIEEAGCANCPFNTDTHGVLFADWDSEGGRCEKAECYVRRWNEATDAKIEALRKKRVAVKEARQKWDIPNSWGAKDRRTKTNTEPWVYTEDGLKRLVWAEPRPAAASAPAKTEEEKAEAKRIKNAHGAWKKNRASAYEKLRAAIGSDEEKAKYLADALFKRNSFVEKLKDEIVGKFTDGYAYDHECQTYLTALDADDLESIGCEALTDDERKALSEDDPAVKQN